MLAISDRVYLMLLTPPHRVSGSATTLDPSALDILGRESLSHIDIYVDPAG